MLEDQQRRLAMPMHDQRAIGARTGQALDGELKNKTKVQLFVRDTVP